MSTNPNTIKSQDDTTEDELGRTMTLLRAIEQLEKTERKLEKVEKQLDIAVKCLKQYAEIKDILLVSKDGTCQITLRDCEGYHLARETIKEIEEMNK